MDEIPPQIVLQPPVGPNRFAKSAAILSLLAPFVMVLAYVLLFVFMESHGHTRTSTLTVFGIMPFFLVMAGIVLGIISLGRIKRRESKALFGMALAGVVLNALILLLFLGAPFLIPHLLSSGQSQTPQGRLDAAVQKLASATSPVGRVYALSDAAKQSFALGKIEDARKYATDLLAVSSPNNDSSAGVAIHDGNMVLGRIAVREGRMDDAKQYLLAAGQTRGSPTLDSFGPNMSLAKDLLEKGQKDVVLQYFDLCRKFGDMDNGKLDDWSQQVKAGELPEFGANLVY